MGWWALTVRSSWQIGHSVPGSTVQGPEARNSARVGILNVVGFGCGMKLAVEEEKSSLSIEVRSSCPQSWIWVSIMAR